MKMAIILSLILPVLFVNACLATPPTSIDLKYDLDKGNLHVDATHPSFDLEKSYVRLMNIYVNGDQVATTDYFRQDDPQKFIQDVPVTAQVGDTIKVELFCSLGGDMSKEITVTKAKPDSAGQGADADASKQ